MDYRKSLFHLEQWTPTLARRIWGLTSLGQVPFLLGLGIRVKKLSDLEGEIFVPLNRFTKNENGEMHSAALLAAGEFASKVIWQRHIREKSESLSLGAIHGRFFKPASSDIKVRTGLPDLDRERALRKVRSGESVEFETTLIYLDHKDQHVATVNCIWNLKPAKGQPLNIRQGTNL